MSTPTEFIYDTPLWRVRRCDGWYQGESPLFAAPTALTRDHQEARRWIEAGVERFLGEQGYVKAERGERREGTTFSAYCLDCTWGDKGFSTLKDAKAAGREHEDAMLSAAVAVWIHRTWTSRGPG